MSKFNNAGEREREKERERKRERDRERERESIFLPTFTCYTCPSQKSRHTTEKCQIYKWRIVPVEICKQYIAQSRV